MSSLLILNKRFSPLFFTQFLGAMNDNIYKNALVILLTYKGVSLFGMGTEQLIAFSGGVFILPYFLFSAWAGRISDKYAKDKIAKLTKILEIVIMAVAAIALFTESYAWLMVFLFLMGTQSTFFGPVKYSLLPELLNEDELVKGNSYIAGGTFLAILIGTILGGVFASKESFAVELSSILVGVAAIGYVASLFIKYDRKNEHHEVETLSLVRLFQFIKSKHTIYVNLLGVSWFWFLGSAVLSLLPVLAKDFFFGKEEVATYFLTLFTVGMGLGSVFLGIVWKKRLEMGLVSISALLMSFSLIILFLATYFFDSTSVEGVGSLGLSEVLSTKSGIFASLGLTLLAFFGGLFIIPQMTFIQKFSERKFLSQMIAANNIMNAIFMVVAAVIVMALYAFGLSALHILLVMALLNLIVSVMLYAHHSEVTLRFIAQILSKFFYRLKVENSSAVPESGGAILICNHVSFMDWLVLMAASPRPIRFVIDHNYYYAPMMRFWLRQAGLIPIATRKENENVLKKAYARISKNLEEGHLLAIFPEGGITRDGRPKRFQPGISKIVKERPVPIIPVGLSGLWGSLLSYDGGKLFKAPFKFRREITVRFGSIVSATECDLKKLEIDVNNLRHDLVGYQENQTV